MDIAAGQFNKLRYRGRSGLLLLVLSYALSLFAHRLEHVISMATLALPHQTEQIGLAPGPDYLAKPDGSNPQSNLPSDDCPTCRILSYAGNLLTKGLNSFIPKIHEQPIILQAWLLDTRLQTSRTLFSFLARAPPLKA